MAAQAAHLSSPTLSPTPSQTSLQLPQSPTMTASTFADSSHPLTSAPHIHPISSSNEYNLKVQSLKTLVMVLRSLVAWAQQGIAATIESSTTRDDSLAHLASEDSPRSLTPNPSVSRSPSQGDASSRPPFTDDPSQFEALKYRKTALQDAIQKFNFKPKKVSKYLTFAESRGSRLSSAVVLLNQRIQSKLPSSCSILRA